LEILLVRANGSAFVLQARRGGSFVVEQV